MFKYLYGLFKNHQFCPVCNRHVNKFIPLPAYYEENARKYGYPYFGMGETINIRKYSCPHCGASDRERLYALYFNSICKHELEGKPRLLHFSPEPALSRRLHRMDLFEYRTADLMSKDVDDRINICSMFIYPDASFDIFICSHVLEHVSDDSAALRELYRILKQGGWGILMSPVIPNLSTTIEDPSIMDEASRWRYFGQGNHVRLYAKQDFIARISSPGFTVDQLDVRTFGESVFDSAGITRQSVLYIVRKSG